MRNLSYFYIALMLLAGLVGDTVLRCMFLVAIGAMMIAIDVLAGRELALHHLANLRASLIRAADQAGSGRSPAADPAQPDRSPTAE